MQQNGMGWGIKQKFTQYFPYVYPPFWCVRNESFSFCLEKQTVKVLSTQPSAEHKVPVTCLGPALPHLPAEGVEMERSTLPVRLGFFTPVHIYPANSVEKFSVLTFLPPILVKHQKRQTTHFFRNQDFIKRHFLLYP